jgi:hypothetical protein
VDWLIFAAPSIATGELSGWLGNTLSIGALIMLIVGGLATSRLWTKSQVNELKSQHTAAMLNAETQHAATLRNVEQVWKARCDDAIRREGEWKAVADKWQQSSTVLADGFEAVQEQGSTMLTIVRELQRAGAR